MFILLILATGMLIFPLSDHALKQASVGQVRPLNYPASLKVRNAVRERVAIEKDIEVVMVARVGVEQETGIRVLLVSPSNISEKLSSDLDVIINNVVGEVIPVRVVRLKGKAKDYRVATK